MNRATKTYTETSDGPNDELQRYLDGCDSGDAFAADPATYQDHRFRAFWEGIDPGNSGFGGGAGEVDYSLAEDALAARMDYSEESDDVEVEDLSGAFRPRKKVGPAAPDPIVDEWWFPEGVERDAFCLIRDHAKNLRLGQPELTGRQLEWRADALAFFFAEPSLQHYRLDECVMALDESIRPDVVRMRLAYEMLERWLVLPVMIDDCVALPSVVRDRLYAEDRILDEAICEQVWCQPGIESQRLLPRVAAVVRADRYLTKHVPEHELDTAFMTSRLEALVHEGTIGAYFNNCYLVGRNPRAEADARARSARTSASLGGDLVSWSRLF